jgi:hypothetical protein
MSLDWEIFKFEKEIKICKMETVRNNQRTPRKTFRRPTKRRRIQLHNFTMWVGEEKKRFERIDVTI